MRRLIDANALHMILVKMKDFGELTAKKAIRVVENAPTIDAVPIDYMRSQIDCEKWEEIITRWKEHAETD